MNSYRIVFDPFNGSEPLSLDVTVHGVHGDNNDVEKTIKRWAKAVNESHIVANMRVYKEVEEDITP